MKIVSYCFLLFISLALPARADQTPPVVVELFTSQGCSSCPPADRFLEELSRQDGVIALGCHVTYWDHLRWKDTMSLEGCTARQENYSRALGQRHLFTPQMIVNGRYSAVGSEEREIRDYLKKAAEAPVKSIVLARDRGMLNLSLPAAERGELLLISYGTTRQETIGSGENRGRAVPYANPVRAIRSLGRSTGLAEKRSVPLNGDTGPVAVILQTANQGRIIAAGKIE
ncbi:MAG: DUF1223 domain-containing protein [Rhodospirillales bacterium]|nr:DUF1223 domain-containing protein [Rhodospirillales bacterium]MCB9996766.1 DUF1223 domain-containing protein [Rhodospirillales bacterium]